MNPGPILSLLFPGCSERNSAMSTTYSCWDALFYSGPNQGIRGSWDEISELEPKINRSYFIVVEYLRHFATVMER